MSRDLSNFRNEKWIENVRLPRDTGLNNGAADNAFARTNDSIKNVIGINEFYIFKVRSLSVRKFRRDS